MRKFWRSLWPCILCVAVVCGIFAPPNHADYFFYDDPPLISDVPQITSGLSVENAMWALRSHDHNNWAPLARWSHQLDASMFHDEVSGPRWESVLWHAGNMLLVSTMLRRFGVKTGLAWGMALAWALHPLHVETVAWLSNRKHLLATTMALGATLCWWAPETKGGSGRLRRILASLLFALSLMARPTAVLLPLVWLAGDRWKFRSEVKWRDLVMPLALPFLLSFLSIFATLLGQDGHRQDWVVPPSMADGFWIAPLGAFHLALHGILPVNLVFHYPLPASVPWPKVVAGTALLLVTGLLIWRLRKRNSPAAIGLFLALATWLPSSGLIPLGDLLTADRFAYLPILGTAMTAASFGQRIFKPVLKWSFIAGLIIAWAIISKLQMANWTDSDTVFSQARKVLPEDPFIRIQWGMWEVRRRNLPAACGHLQEALRLDERSLIARYNLAVTQLHMGEPQLCAENIRIFLMSQGDSPDAHWLLSLAEYQNANLAASLNESRKVLQLQPNHLLAQQRVKELEVLLTRKAPPRRRPPAAGTPGVK